MKGEHNRGKEGESFVKDKQQCSAQEAQRAVITFTAAQGAKGSDRGG